MATQPTPQQLANRRNAVLGGLARAKKLSAKRRREIATKAGNATKAAYGIDIYSHISKLGVAARSK